jgi:hypothetical protein
MPSFSPSAPTPNLVVPQLPPSSARAHPRLALARAREELDDAAGVVAVHGGEGAAHHLDALGGVEVEGGRLALAVRVGGRDAVCDELDAAHAEGRARAETAHRDLQVLSVVLAVLDHQSGHAGERLGGIHAEVAGLVGAHVHRIDRVGQVEALGGGGRAGDHDRIERHRLRGGLLRAGKAGEAGQRAGNAEAEQGRELRRARAAGDGGDDRAGGGGGDCAVLRFHGGTPGRA